ncbi:related to Muconate cycloisomerase 1 [Ramularia collo-cygni]|uniref:Related to Muconate cycloisomerase 1 n=1 Tax=Ramularia collo-cygni TaxID=112498 RepID=A0A2D3UQ13_9PEZI|nr:related to Muconate cycloisomerase 1 [Ramularia collo-cygni]CZT15165.1 related to Muconate cycloisomerase 1 [Ramularia collo-cygni]
MDFLVGTFNHPSLYLLQFTPPSPSQPSATLKLLKDHPAIAGHSWLSLSPTKEYLYCTAWTTKPSVAAYHLKSSAREIQFLNAKQVASLSGYVCSNSTHLFSAGGPSGEVFRLEADGSIGNLVQTLDFVTDQGENQSEKRGEVAHGDFGGLRHGAHSVDLSPDGKALYIADIGRNCIWTYAVVHSKRGIQEPPLRFGGKFRAPRGNDGPRHTWPHPNGKILYSLQEHSSMVDVFSLGEGGVTELQHVQGAEILPQGKNCGDFWADEVRYSTGPDPMKPKYLYASTRGLSKDTKGFVAVYRLREDGMLESEVPVYVWETPTSGGLANAIEPAPWREEFGGKEYLAMCDSEEGVVSMLEFDGEKLAEVARVVLGVTEEGKVIGAATPVWL